MTEQISVDARGRLRQISLFPEDLNKDFNPSNFYEERVEPKSFRNLVTNMLGWTVGIPLVLLLVIQQQNIEAFSSYLDREQRGFTEAVATRTGELLSILEGVADCAAEFNEMPEEVVVRLQGTLSSSLAVRRIVPPDEIDDATAKYSSVLPSRHPIAKTELPSLEATGHSLESDIPPKAVLVLGKTPKAPAIELDPQVFVAPFKSELKLMALSLSIFERSGKLIASSEEVATKLSAETLENLLESQVAASDNRSAEGNKPAAEAAAHLANIRTAATIPGTNWVLVLEQDLESRNELLRPGLLFSGVLFLAAVLGIFVVGFFASRPLGRAVESLTLSLNDFAKKSKMPETPEWLKLNGPTELLNFSERFHEAAVQIEKAQEALRAMNVQLEAKVAERTATLARRNAELYAIQRLLAPLGGSLDRTVTEAVLQMRQILGLSLLRFEPAPLNSAATSMKQHSTPTTLNAGCSAIQVAAVGQTFGWLIAPREAVETRESRSSLDRLAASIAVALSNRRMLMRSTRQHAILRDLFSSMTEGVALLDETGCIAEQNACLERICGASLTKGEPLWAFLSSRFEIRRIDETSSQNQPTGFVDGSRYRLSSLREAGNALCACDKTLEATVFGIVREDESESPRGVLGIVLRDVTEEAALEELKDRLISIVAHELKTPITALTLQAETLATSVGLSDADEEEILRDMQAESRRLRLLVDDWLDITRIQNGAIELRKRVMHIATPIDRAAKIVHSRYRIEIRRHIDPEAECFLFDPERMQQVFINLFSNAARYAKENMPARADVRVIRRNDLVEIEVEDQGIGISPDKIPRVFDRFYQADMSSARRSGGTGLGLAIVKGIIEAHGGTVSLKSRVGKGSVFTMTLPY